MKRAFFFIITIISTSYAQQSQDYCKAVDKIAAEESRAYSRISLQDATSSSQNFNIKYYRCEWQVDPAVRYITGKVTSYFIISSPTDNISFDLMDALIVDSIKE